MDTINETSIKIDTFRLIPLMPNDPDNNPGCTASDDDEVNYAVNLEKEIRQSRMIYDFFTDELGQPPTPAVEHPVADLKENTPGNPVMSDKATPKESAIDSDLDLLTLDLGDLEGEYHLALKAQKNAVDSEPEEEDLLGDLDLLGLFDKEELPFAQEDGTGFSQPAENKEDIGSADDLFEKDDVDHLEDILTENDNEEEDSFWDISSIEPETDDKEKSAVDWFGGEFENDEFLEDAKPDVEYDVDVEVGISREQRAQQAAISTALQFQLDNDCVRILTEIYLTNGWSACRVAIERELDAGTEIEELALAAAIKKLWLEHYEYYAGMSSYYKVMSWPTALVIVRSFDGYPSIEEVEVLLEQLYEHWYYSVARIIHRSFGMYVINWFYSIRKYGAFEGEWNLVLISSFNDETLLPPATCDIPMAIGHSAGRVSFADIRQNVTA